METKLRREDVPFFKKSLKRQVDVTERFNLLDSVFRDWKAPKERTWKQMMQFDLKHWKVRKFEKKDANEAKLINEMF